MEHRRAPIRWYTMIYNTTRVYSIVYYDTYCIDINNTDISWILVAYFRLLFYTETLFRIMIKKKNERKSFSTFHAHHTCASKRGARGKKVIKQYILSVSPGVYCWTLKIRRCSGERINKIFVLRPNPQAERQICLKRTRSVISATVTVIKAIGSFLRSFN